MTSFEVEYLKKRRILRSNLL